MSTLTSSTGQLTDACFLSGVQKGYVKEAGQAGGRRWLGGQPWSVRVSLKPSCLPPLLGCHEVNNFALPCPPAAMLLCSPQAQSSRVSQPWGKLLKCETEKPFLP